MVIELVGLPAVGKTYLLNKVSEHFDSNNYFFVDAWYNKKTKFKKATFLISKIFCLFDKRFFAINKMIKEMQNDDINHKNFYLRQFRLDFILAKYALKLEKERQITVIFSENLLNLSNYIFYRRKKINEVKNYIYFKKYILLLKNIIHRDYVIAVETNKTNNMKERAKRSGVNSFDFENAGGGLRF